MHDRLGLVLRGEPGPSALLGGILVEHFISGRGSAPQTFYPLYHQCKLSSHLLYLAVRVI